MNTSVLRAELVKLRTLRSTWWFLGVIAALAIAVSGLAVHSPGKGRAPGLEEALYGPAFTQLLIPLLGVRSVSQDLRTGTIWSSFLAVPSWNRLLIGKATVVALVAAAAGLLVEATALGVALLVEPAVALVPSCAEGWRPLLALPVTFAIGGVLGVAVGLLLRGGLADTLLVMWPLALEPALGAAGKPLLGFEVAAWLPYGTMNEFSGQSGGVPFFAGPSVAGVYTAVIVVCLLALGIRRQKRREP